MFKEDLNAFFNDFAELVIYSNNSYSTQLKAIIDHNVNLIGFEGEIAGTATTFTTESNSDIVIGGIFNLNTDSYEIDSIINDDKTLMTVSVVKQ
ncbi:MAG: hypothetical protein GY694_17160, partial [Gammaproteobacteria bacterium]|nr:hypothetical protein [Gammaproteobacteria bacterium]